MFIMEKIFTNTLIFLEGCQTAFFKGDIDFGMYYYFTNIKLKFINLILKSEDTNKFLDDALKTRLYNIHLNECFISYVVTVLDK